MPAVYNPRINSERKGTHYENNGTVNLYLTSRNKKVYMYEFREEKNANTISCEQYNTSILNSIYYK